MSTVCPCVDIYSKHTKSLCPQCVRVLISTVNTSSRYVHSVFIVDIYSKHIKSLYQQCVRVLISTVNTSSRYINSVSVC